MKRRPGMAPMDASTRFWSKVDKTGDCWEWTGALTHGYGVFGLSVPVRRTIRAHRFAWEEAHGPVLEDQFVCHHCDNRRCVRVDHLFVWSVADNNHDAIRKGRWPQIAGGRPMFSAAEAAEIRARYESERISLSALARDYGVAVPTIGRVVRGEGGYAA